jgi:hypothetical protein
MMIPTFPEATLDNVELPLLRVQGLLLVVQKLFMIGCCTEAIVAEAERQPPPKSRAMIKRGFIVASIDNVNY